jgi:hypothetical protein
VAVMRLNRRLGPRRCEQKEDASPSGSPRADGAGRISKSLQRRWMQSLSALQQERARVMQQPHPVTQPPHGAVPARANGSVHQEMRKGTTSHCTRLWWKTRHAGVLGGYLRKRKHLGLHALCCVACNGTTISHPRLLPLQSSNPGLGQTQTSGTVLSMLSSSKVYRQQQL